MRKEQKKFTIDQFTTRKVNKREDFAGMESVILSGEGLKVRLPQSSEIRESYIEISRLLVAGHVLQTRDLSQILEDQRARVDSTSVRSYIHSGRFTALTGYL